ncbi:MAG: PIN domain-containing protein [Actinomycetota bacterium]
MIVADTSGLLALFNRREPAHEAVAAVVEADAEPLVVSSFVISELDYLAATRLGVVAELAILSELASGAYHLAAFDENDMTGAGKIIERYQDQQIGLGRRIDRNRRRPPSNQIDPDPGSPALRRPAAALRRKVPHSSGLTTSPEQ